MIKIALYSAANEFICRLPEWTSTEVGEELNNAGSAGITFPRNGLNVQKLLDLEDGIIRIEQAGHETFGFIFDTEDEDLAVEDGAIRIAGPGEMMVLDRALIYPQYGVGKDPKFGFGEKTPGFIMKTLIDLAKERGAIPSVTYSFNSTVDSAGAPWRFTTSINFEPVSLFAALQNLTNNGWVDAKMINGVLHMYNPDVELAKPRIGRWQNVYRTGGTIGSGTTLDGNASSVIDLTNPVVAGATPWNLISTATLNVVEEGPHGFQATFLGSTQIYVDGQPILPASALSSTAIVPTTYTGMSSSLKIGSHSVEVRHAARTSSSRLLVEYAPPGQAYHPIRTYDPVIIRRAREVTSAPRKKQRSTVATHVLVVGQDGINLEVASPVLGVDRREVLLSDSRLSLNGTMISFGQRHLATSRDPSEGSTVVVDQAATPYSPRRDYGVGDYIYCDHLRTANRVLIPQRVSTVANSWQADGTVQTSLELNDVFLEAAVKNKRKIEGITNGAANDSATGVAYVDQTTPKPVTLIGMDWSPYQTQDGTSFFYGVVTWDEVTENTDGSPYDDPDGFALSYTINGGESRGEVKTGPSPAQIDGVRPGDIVVVTLVTTDVNGHRSTPFVSPEFRAPSDTEGPLKPTRATAEPLVRGARLTWDGLSTTETGDIYPQPPDYKLTQVWQSVPDTAAGGSDFLPPLQGTLIDSIVGGGVTPVSNLDYTKNYYFRYISYDRLGNPSPVGDPVGPVKPIAQDVIDVTGVVLDASNLDLVLGGVNYVRNSSFENDVEPVETGNGIPDNWTMVPAAPSTIAGWSISTERTQGVIGSKAMKYTFTNATGMSFPHYLASGSTVPCGVGQNLIASAYVYIESDTTAASSSAVEVRVEFVDNSGNVLLSKGASQGLEMTRKGVWQRVSSGAITAPAGTAFARIAAPYVTVPSGGGRVTLYADNVQLEVSDVMTSYAPMPDDIGPGVIKRTNIGDGEIVTPKLAADAVIASKIAADAVTARHMLISNFENLAEDPTFELPDATSTWIRPIGWRISETGGRNNGRCASFSFVSTSTEAITNANSVPVRQGDVYLFDAYISSDAAANGSANVRLIGYDSTGGEVTSARVEGNIITPGTTFRVSSAQMLVPDSVVRVQASVIVKNSVVGAWFVDDVFFKRMQNAEMIVDGAIVARHVSTTSFNALVARIDQAIITEAMIGSVSATSIRTGILQADVTLSGRIATAATGARVEMNRTGLKQYDSVGNLTVDIGTTGDAKFTGIITGSEIVGSFFSTAGFGVETEPKVEIFPASGTGANVGGVIAFTPVNGDDYALITSAQRLYGTFRSADLYLQSGKQGSTSALALSTNIRLTPNQATMTGPRGGEFKLADNDAAINTPGYIALRANTTVELKTNYVQGAGDIYLTTSDLVRIRHSSGQLDQQLILRVYPVNGVGSAGVQFSDPGAADVYVKAALGALEIRNAADDAFKTVKASQFVVSSDRRKKSNVVPVDSTDALATVKSWGVNSYTIDDSPGIRRGLMSEDLETDLITIASDGTEGVDVYGILATLVAAVQSLSEGSNPTPKAKPDRRAVVTPPAVGRPVQDT